jgi:dTDP-4-dehydrorhamnose reductase
MIWVVGSKGMLGSETVNLFTANGLKFIGSDREVDILDINALNYFCEKHKPTWIINCSGYTNVDLAESEADKAFELNATGTINLSKCAKKIDARIIHISTDYVFGVYDKKIPLTENFMTLPESVYGKTKLAGEWMIQSMVKKYFIIRTSWLYGLHGKNFVNTMLHMFNEKSELKVVNDQWGSPTWTYDLSNLFLMIIESDYDKYGIYHYTGEGSITWYEFAMEIYTQSKNISLQLSDCIIKPCTSSEYQTRAIRPEWSVLSKEKIKNLFNIVIPDWKISLNKYLNNLKERNNEKL